MRNGHSQEKEHKMPQITIHTREGVLKISKKKDLQKASASELLAAFNKITTGKQLKKFKDRETAETKFWDALKELAPTTNLDGKKKKKPAKTKAKKPAATKKAKAKKSKKAKAKKSTPRKADTRKITKLVKKNPYREDSLRAQRFSWIRNGMTVDQYVEIGGKRKDIRTSVGFGYIKVK